MYCPASASTWNSSSRSLSPTGNRIFLVMTADPGSANATFLVLLPDLRTTLRNASATSSNFSILPSVTQPRSNGSIAQCSNTCWPLGARPSSTSLMVVELISMPSNGAGARCHKAFHAAINAVPLLVGTWCSAREAFAPGYTIAG